MRWIAVSTLSVWLAACSSTPTDPQVASGSPAGTGSQEDGSTDDANGASSSTAQEAATDDEGSGSSASEGTVAAGNTTSTDDQGSGEEASGAESSRSSSSRSSSSRSAPVSSDGSSTGESAIPASIVPVSLAANRPEGWALLPLLASSVEPAPTGIRVRVITRAALGWELRLRERTSEASTQVGRQEYELIGKSKEIQPASSRSDPLPPRRSATVVLTPPSGVSSLLIYGLDAQGHEICLSDAVPTPKSAEEVSVE